MKKDQRLPVFEYKIFPSLRKKFFHQTYLHLLYVLKTSQCKYVWWKNNFSLDLEKFCDTSTQYYKFFLNKLLSGKRFEQFSCRQKTPEKSRKIIFSNSSVENLFFLTEICQKKNRLRDFFVECCTQTTEIAVFEYSAIMDSSNSRGVQTSPLLEESIIALYLYISIFTTFN